jgi:hypothetical protein
MASTINNSYTRAALSGFMTSTIAEFSNRSMPISLTTAISLTVSRSFNYLSKSLETNRKAIDETIAKFTAPAIFMAGTTYFFADPEHPGNMTDTLALGIGLMATNKQAIQPIVRFIAPVQTTHKVISLVQQIPLLKHYPSLMKLSASYLISSLASQAIENSYAATDTLGISEKFAITTFLTFAAIDLYPTFISVIGSINEHIMPNLTSIDIVNSNHDDPNEILFDESELDQEDDLPESTFKPLPEEELLPMSPNSVIFEGKLDPKNKPPLVIPTFTLNAPELNLID